MDVKVTIHEKEAPPSQKSKAVKFVEFDPESMQEYLSNRRGSLSNGIAKPWLGFKWNFNAHENYLAVIILVSSWHCFNKRRELVF